MDVPERRAQVAESQALEVRPRHAHRTRRAVNDLLNAGKSQAEIARELGLSKSTVAFHVRALGVVPDQKFRRRYDWEAVQKAHDGGMRALECCRHFGFSKATWSSAVRRGDIISRSHLIPHEDFFARGARRNRTQLKQRLLDLGLKENACESCGISAWCDRPLSLQLHHVNGDGLDQRVENLQLLCPNCHSQTDTYGGRNGHRRRPAA